MKGAIRLSGIEHKRGLLSRCRLRDETMTDPRTMVDRMEGGAPTVIDLFAGCGGMTQGFKDAGFESIFAVEWDEEAAATYAANHDPEVNHTFCADIASVASADVPKANVVIGVLRARASQVLACRMSTILATSCGRSTCGLCWPLSLSSS